MIAPLKQLAPEVRAQPVAEHGDVAVVYEVDEVVDLVLRQELRLVDDDAGVLLQLLVRHGAHLVEVDARVLESDARVDHVVAVARVELGLDEQRPLPALFVVKARHQGVGRLARAHRPVFEIQLCHRFILLLRGRQAPV